MSDPNAPTRFNEDQATYTVRGSDAPDLEAGIAAIRNVLATLPVRPGVYRMLDARGDVLYVGKAKALKNRVTNYTQVERLTKRLQRMVAQTRRAIRFLHIGCRLLRVGSDHGGQVLSGEVRVYPLIDFGSTAAGDFGEINRYAGVLGLVLLDEVFEDGRAWIGLAA